MKAARKMTKAVQPVPEGYHTVTSRLAVRGADRAIAFYKQAFGAQLLERMPGPDGKTVMHACLQIGDSRIFLSDEIPGMGIRAPGGPDGATSSFYLYVEDVDEAFRRAIDAGGTERHPVMNAFWGDRCGTITDPFGYQWDLATHKEDLSPDEIRKRGDEFFKTQGGGTQS